MRELRQQASRYLRRVEAGETFQITERGRPVAVLAPTMDALTSGIRAVIDELVAAGRYPSAQVALGAGIEQLAHDVRGALIDAAIVDSYARSPDEPDRWIEEAAVATFREMDAW